MKRKIAVLVLMLPYALLAQQTNVFSVDAKKISQSETPVTVVEAVKTDFPGNEIIDYYLYDDDLVNTEWAVTTEDNIEPDQAIDHYSVLLKGKNGGYAYGLYDKNGKLKSVKVVALNFALPAAIRNNATTGKYSGYTIKSDKFVRVVNRKNDKEYLEVSVEKGSDKKKLYFSPEGDLIKEK
ncbi:hypothetical protein WBG78_09805 [Chryseolinea sp. T2]|uniref:hypothetical protein n=1 Tax=Chryseolinea sp. T2 TaxID=3129255 RepID=UPI0030785E2C